MKKQIIFGLILLSTSAFTQIPLDGLVGYYPFSGDANDISGSGNHGIVHNAALTTDRFGNINSAYQFVGNDDNTVSYISADYNNLPVGNSPRTISVWVTHDTYPLLGGGGNDGHPIIAYGSPTTNSANEILFAKNPPDNNFIRFGGFNNDMDLDVTYDLSTWYNLVATFDGTTSKLFVNNVLIGSGSFPAWDTIMDSLLIGTQTPKTRYHNGKIDDILIYNRVLSADEITAIYTDLFSDCIIPLDGLVGFYPFSGDANDISGSGNHGIVHNATLTTDRFGNINSAYQFIGNDDNTVSYISADYNNLPAGNSPRTISVWVTHDTYPLLGGGGNDGHPIIAYGSPTTNSANEILFAKNPPDNNFIRFGGFNNDMDLDVTYDLSTWYNLVATFDGTTSKLFVNNVLIGSGSFPAWETIMDSLLIGTQTPKTRYHNGKIDDILIYNRVLSSDEITAIYCNTDIISSVSELQRDQLLIYPNPASNYFIINSTEVNEIEIFDLNARLILSVKVNNLNSVPIDCSKFQKGIYVLSIRTKNNSIKTDKIVIE